MSAPTIGSPNMLNSIIPDTRARRLKLVWKYHCDSEIWLGKYYRACLGLNEILSMDFRLVTWYISTNDYKHNRLELHVFKVFLRSLYILFNNNIKYSEFLSINYTNLALVMIKYSIFYTIYSTYQRWTLPSESSLQSCHPTSGSCTSLSLGTWIERVRLVSFQEIVPLAR